MKKTILETELSEDLCNYIERLYYERTSYKELVESIAINKGPLGKDTKTAKYYGECFVNANMAFNMAIREIVALFITDESVNKDLVNVDISFSTLSAVFSVEEKGGCGCSL